VLLLVFLAFHLWVIQTHQHSSALVLAGCVNLIHPLFL
jgi:hypothetical protein